MTKSTVPVNSEAMSRAAGISRAWAMFRATHHYSRLDASTPARLRPSNPQPLAKQRKSMTNSTDTTRRGFLSTAAALAASAAVAIPANAANALGADPILEAIEAHRAARIAFENAVSRNF